MAFRINTNVDALKAYSALANVNKQTTTAQYRMATGKRINTVADDTSGFNIGKSLEGRIAVSKGALNNVSSAKDLLSTAEGSLLHVNDLLISIEGKLSDATNPTANRDNIAKDIQALSNEIQSTLNTTKFNNTALLSGSGNAAVGFTFQVGADSTDTLSLDFAASIVSSGTNAAFNASLGGLIGASEGSLTASADLSTLQANLATLKSQVGSALSKIGNFVQRLDIKEETLNISISNAQSSFSRLFDADMAMEQLNATRGSIIGQAATSMLSQLNTAPQQVLSLFR